MADSADGPLAVVAIRPSAADDLDAVAEVWWRSRLASTPAIPEPVHPFPEVRSWLAGLIHRSTAAATGDGGGAEDGPSAVGADHLEVWVAATAAAAVGGATVVAVLVLDGAELDQLYVDPALAGRGIGSQLVEHAKRRRPDGLTLRTFQANDRARAFYRRHGFVEGATTDDDNEEQAPDVRLTWDPARA